MSRLDEVHAETADHLAAIARLWKPGTKLTLLARQPAAIDGSQDYVATDDELEHAIAALRIRLGEPAAVPVATGEGEALRLLRVVVSMSASVADRCDAMDRARVLLAKADGGGE